MTDKDGTNTASVFKKVSEVLESDDVARSLWQKLLLETGSGGGPSAITYLRSRFVDLSAQVTAALPEDKDL